MVRDLHIDSSCIILNGKHIRLFIVSQGKTYSTESERGHLFAPIKGYPKMKEVRAGDIIFSSVSIPETTIKSINVAFESSVKTYGTKEGQRIDCLYDELSSPLKISPLKKKLAGRDPFNLDGHIPERGYIHRLDTKAARLLLNEIIKSGNKPL